MREKAIAEYHELLMNDESLTAELFARLKGGMSATFVAWLTARWSGCLILQSLMSHREAAKLDSSC